VISDLWGRKGSIGIVGTKEMPRRGCVNAGTKNKC
jgi:hypothetical protein